MATLINRSRYTVRVARKPELDREFPHTEVEAAREYLKSLREQGHPGRLEQGDEHWYVRIRQRGYAELNFDGGPLQKAEAAAARIEAERTSGLFTDYTKGHRVSFAELIERYVQEVCPRHKSCAIERTILESLLWDISPAFAARVIERRRDRALEAGKKPRILPPRHTRRVAIEWLQRPIAQVMPTDINKYIAERQEEDLAPATIDREIDLLSQVITWSMKTLRIHLQHSPLFGVIRPGYFNERDRRLVGDEEARLFAAAREEDRLRAIETALISYREQAARMSSSDSTRKRFLRRTRAGIEADPARLPITPYYEGLLTLLLGTAARRSELLALTWTNVNLEASSGYLPDTKNGRARSLVLRQRVVQILKRLPRAEERVFPLSVNEVRSAWYRICERAGLEDFHMHDLRHVALTSICETARRAGAPLTVFELAAVSGHRDLRCLARYLNLCAGELAKRIDEAYQLAATQSERDRAKQGWSREDHKGRRRPRIRVTTSTFMSAAAASLSEVKGTTTPGTLQNTRTANKLPA